jgi:hypothetical protein
MCALECNCGVVGQRVRDFGAEAVEQVRQVASVETVAFPADLADQGSGIRGASERVADAPLSLAAPGLRHSSM